MSSFLIATQGWKQPPGPFQVPEEQSDQGSARGAGWQGRVEGCSSGTRLQDASFSS